MVAPNVQLFGKSAIGLLDGGMDYSGLPPNTFASHFRHNGGSDLAEVTICLTNLLNAKLSIVISHTAHFVGNLIYILSLKMTDDAT